MSIVQWSIPIIGKWVNNRTIRIIGASLSYNEAVKVCHAIRHEGTIQHLNTETLKISPILTFCMNFGFEFR
jgi:hypothetical protein